MSGIFSWSVEEALDAQYKCQEIRRQLYIVDATEETNPLPVATFKVPDGDFCERGAALVRINLRKQKMAKSSGAHSSTLPISARD